jgi:hypothetical protein
VEHGKADELPVAGEGGFDREFLGAYAGAAGGGALGGQVADVARMDAGPVGDAGQLDRAAVGQVGDKAGVGDVEAAPVAAAGFEGLDDPGAVLDRAFLQLELVEFAREPLGVVLLILVLLLAAYPATWGSPAYTCPAPRGIP